MSWNHQKKPLNSNPKELSNPAEKANQVNPLFNANVLPAPTMDSPCRSLVFRPNQTNSSIMLLKYHSLMVTAPALTKKRTVAPKIRFYAGSACPHLWRCRPWQRPACVLLSCDTAFHVLQMGKTQAWSDSTCPAFQCRSDTEGLRPKSQKQKHHIHLTRAKDEAAARRAILAQPGENEAKPSAHYSNHAIGCQHCLIFAAVDPVGHAT